MRWLMVVLGAWILSVAAGAQVTLTPAVVVAGAPELVRVDAAAGARVTGSWLGHPLKFFRGQAGWYALAGVDVEAPVGDSALAISVKEGGRARDAGRTVVVHAARYRTSALTVPPKFVEPGPEDQKLIDVASAAKVKAFAETAEKPLWTGDFVAPVGAQATDSFGTRRMLNGKLAAIHKGMDFRAATGTVVKAGNAGVVVLAQPLYYEGNCVMVDHGLGLMSIYMHFSRIDVKPGQRVAKGERLGLSGATGRVTGPHLHWAIRWEGAMLDPAKVMRLRLEGVR